MLFSIIYSVDVPRDETVNPYLPREEILKKMDETEDDDCYEYNYLEGDWENGHHTKICGVLNKEEFSKFIDDTNLYAEDVETMGSIGAPGLGFGCSPAISFNGDEQNAILSAYVTPIPEITRGECKENDWDRIKKAVLNMFGR